MPDGGARSRSCCTRYGGPRDSSESGHGTKPGSGRALSRAEHPELSCPARRTDSHAAGRCRSPSGNAPLDRGSGRGILISETRYPLRIAIASILQESNTFSPVNTRYADFNPVFGRDASVRHEGKLTEMGGFIHVLKKARVEIVPVCAAWAITANRLVRPDFERLTKTNSKTISAARRPTGCCSPCMAHRPPRARTM